MTAGNACPPTHAGTVVFRTGAHGPEFLLIRPNSGAAEWVLPKGHLKPGETPAQAAVRETREEAGLAVALVTALGRVRFAVGGTDVRADFFLAKAASEVAAEDDRGRIWLPADAATEAASHAETRELLAQAARWISGRAGTG